MAEVESQFTTFRDRFQASLDPAARMVRLNGVDAYPQGRATVIWNETNGQVFFTLQDLPQPAPGQQYQLWALIDGQPVDAGVFDYETGNLQALKSVALNGGNLDAFAITLEPTGGSTVPTLTNMYLLGQA
jgi:anti-sigma-K factor RskA